MITASQKLFTVTEAAKELGLSPVRVRQFCQEGRIGRKHGTFWLIDEGELKRFARQERPAGGRREKNPK
jgi:hypothetical protein